MPDFSVEDVDQSDIAKQGVPKVVDTARFCPSLIPTPAFYVTWLFAFKGQAYWPIKNDA